MIILGIETSCDETAVSVIKTEKSKLKVLSNSVSSQIKIHAKWGGVVPNLAAREHLKNIIPVLELSLKKAKVSQKDIGLIAVTQGPGLIPALLIGTNTAKTLSYIWNKPLLGIHHIEGHIYANFVGKSKIQNPKSQIFPILCLVVSGGHTQLILMEDHLKYKIIGQTLDDAVGEAFDKVARMLDLGYPGGPAIAACAAKHKTLNPKSRNTKYEILNTTLPRPMMNKNNFNFSFSGLKTAVLYEIKKNNSLLKNKCYVREMCQEFQQAAIDVLIAKTIKAAEKHNPKTVMLAGGVSANKELRQQIKKELKKEFPEALFMIPDSSHCIDNAAMIASAGYFRWRSMDAAQRKRTMQNWKTLQADANLLLSSLKK